MNDEAAAGSPAGRRRRRILRVIRVAVIGCCTLALAAALLIMVRWPAMAAMTCPECYGLQRLTGGVYVERGLPAGERARAVRVLATARQRVAAFYGPSTASPRILVCTTDECYRRIGGGGEAGAAVLNEALMLAPRGVTEVIASHELSHVELRHRLRGGTVPQWFNEGLAVVVSDDPRYLGPASAADRCLVEPGGPLPETLADWLADGSGNDHLYPRAACAVERWMGEHGGRAAVVELVERLAAGESFERAAR